MATNHEMNYYDYAKTLSAEGIMLVLSRGENPEPEPEPKPEELEFIDMGLPSGLLWATCNIGASAPEETGLYFAWGETQGYTSGQVGTDKYFAWEGEHADYEFGEWVDQQPDYGMTKYNSVDGLETLESEDDAATVNCGSDCRMPKDEEFDELFENTDTAWTIRNGVNGLLLTSNVEGHEDDSLFFPLAGGAEGGNIFGVGEEGGYWTSSLSLGGCEYAYLFLLNSYCRDKTDSERCSGYVIRPVRSQNL